MICKNCGAETNVLLIDTTLMGEERRRTRFCGSCKPEALHDLAGYAPRMLAHMNLPEEVRRAALAAQRYVMDRSHSYPLAQRIADLGPFQIRNRTLLRRYMNLSSPLEFSGDSIVHDYKRG